MNLKKDKLTCNERIEALFMYQKPDRVPICGMGSLFSCRNYGYPIEYVYNEPQKSFEAQVRTNEMYGWDLMDFTHTVLGSWDFGGEISLPKSEYEGALMVKSYAVSKEEDVSVLKLPDPRHAGRITPALEFAKLQDKNDLPIYFFSRSPFCTAADICGLHQLSRWMLKKPDLCHTLIRIAIDHIFNVLGYWVDTFGAKNILVGMSSPTESNQVISPVQFKEFALPYHREYHSRLQLIGIKRFYFHICGDQRLNLPQLADSLPWNHPSILSFGHEVDLNEAAGYFPKDIIFGNIEPAVFQEGTPTEVYDLCRVAITKGKKSQGGFILAPGCGMPIAAPPANVFAMTKAVNDFGWYE
jgi:uroporphyrinogen decarboxylase